MKKVQKTCRKRAEINCLRFSLSSISSDQKTKLSQSQKESRQFLRGNFSPARLDPASPVLSHGSVIVLVSLKKWHCADNQLSLLPFFSACFFKIFSALGRNLFDLYYSTLRYFFKCVCPFYLQSCLICACMSLEDGYSTTLCSILPQCLSFLLFFSYAECFCCIFSLTVGI